MHKATTILVVFVVLGLVSCATAPAPRPLGPESAAIGISVKIYQVGPDLSAQQVYLIKLNEGEGLYTQGNFIRSNYVKGGQAYFLNLKPGRYAAVGSHTNVPAPFLGHGRTYEYKVFFPKELIKLTEVTVAPNTIAFMGKYVVKQSMSFGDADEAQLHYLQLIAPGAQTGLLRLLTTKQSYRGLLLEEHSDKQDEIEFLTNAQKHFQDSAWINIVHKRLEEIEAEKNQKIEPDKLVVTGLQAEPTKQQVEVEKLKKGPPQTKPKVSEKQKLAYVPKTTTVARVSLRNEPKKLLEKNIKRMVLTHDFYDEDLNWQGSFANDFVDNGDATVTDRATGLMWQKDGSSRSLTIKRATSYIGSLNMRRFAGYSDWRLPTIEEVASLVEREKVNGIHIDPLFDNKQKRCWSSDSTGMPGYKGIGTARGGWVVNFVSGEISEASWSSTRNPHVLAMYVFPDNYVKAVRLVKKSAQVKPSGKSSGEQEGRKLVRQKVEKVSLRQKPEKLFEKDVRKMVLTYDFYDGDLNWQGSFANDFVDNGDATVTDRATGLMWQRSGSQRSLTIKRATSYIRKLNKSRFAGYSDWRLPTIDELASLLREERTTGSRIDPLFDTKQKHCWSSDTGTVEDRYLKEVWIVNFAEGRVVQQILTDHVTWRGEYTQTYYVRGVRSAK